MKEMHRESFALCSLLFSTPFSTLMYSHRDEKNRVDVVDLDPYGTAAPFIDAAVQCVKDNGQHSEFNKIRFGRSIFL